MTRVPPSNTVTPLLPVSPTKIRPALTRIGRDIKSHIRTPSFKMAESRDGLAPPTQPNALSSSSSPASSRDSSVAGQKLTTGGADVSIATETSPLPRFLRQTAREILVKFEDLEWAERQRLSTTNTEETDPSDPYAQYQEEGGEVRNRYANVRTYANTRVQLKVPEEHCDYINASPVNLISTKSGTERKFIATQGPKESSFSHIWRMIWDETADPAVVIMLTQTHESGREKCFPYYPQTLENPSMAVNEDDEFGDGAKIALLLKSIHEDEETKSIIRELELRTVDGKTKTVWHLLFSAWPDFLVPEGEDKLALINLLRLSRAKNAQHPDSPRIVHCSAGVGRTGTFMALDWLLHELDEGSLDEVADDVDPVVDIVDRLRTQRMMMVQGVKQFTFLYNVVRDFWLERWRQRQVAEVDAAIAEGQ